MSDIAADPTEAKEKTPAASAAASHQPPEVKPPVEMERSGDNLLYRYTDVASGDVISEDTFQIAAASEFPGQQLCDEVHARLGIAKEGELYTEILSHNEGDADLSFFNTGRASFLDEHKTNRHLGNIKKATLSTDKVTRVLVQCDEVSKLSKTRKKQLGKKSRMNVSCGYIHTKYLGTKKLDDGTIGHRFAWQGREVSSVGDPLDPTVGLQRAAAVDKTCCFGCGKQMKSADMVKSDDALYCSQDCIDAETPADESEERKAGEKMFRSKSKDGTETRISIKDLEQKLYTALDADKRFKVKRDNGDVHSDFNLKDIHQIVGDGDNDDWQVLVTSPAWRSDSKLFAVDFTFENGEVTLGESTEVNLKQTLEAVERAQPFDAKQFRSVDSGKIAEAEIHAPNILTRKFMADKTPEQIAAETIAQKPELVVDSLATPHVQRKLTELGYRSKVELEAAANTSKANLKARNDEITALETEFSRDFGSRIAYRNLAGGKKEPVYLRDAIHIAAMEACAHDESKPATEIRQIFRSKVDDLKRDSVSEENIKRSIDAAEMGLAGRCEDVFSVIKRTLADAHSKGTQTRSLMPTGAELEYSDEVRGHFKSMPGCSHIADLGGFMSPPKQGRKFEGKMVRGGASARRMQRDALASDFGTVGAMIAPEFRPYIELLRNSTVLDKLGCTYIGGCNGEQVFPRQDAATVAQSVAEGSQLNPYDQTLGQIKMTPKRVGSRQYYSRLAVIQAVPGWETMVWNDHAQVLALYQDEMGINGSGAADQPVGILNQPGINQLVFGGTPTYNNILNFRTQIRKFNVPGELAFCTTSVGQGRLAYLPAALNGSTVITQGELDAIWKGDEENGEMLGCKAVASQQIPGDILLAGVFSQLLMASWGGIFTTLDNYTRADRDEVAITFNTYFDIAVRHAQAFTRSLDSVNQ